MIFPSLYPWRRTGSDGTTLLSLAPYVQRGKAWLEDHVWRSFFVDVHVQFLSLSPTNSLIFPLRPPGNFLLLPAGYRWDTLGSISFSEPAQMAAGIPYGKSRQDKLGQMTTANCRKCPTRCTNVKYFKVISVYYLLFVTDLHCIICLKK